MQQFYKKFLKRLNDLRGERSVVAFARDCGIPQPTMQNYCRGERIPSMEAMCRICNANVVSSDWLLGFTEEREGTSAPLSNPVMEKRFEELEAKIKEQEGVIQGLKMALEAVGKRK